MSFATFELRGQVGILSLNRPDRLNAISSDMLDDLHAAFDEAEVCGEATTLVLTGVGRAFCAGEDLKEFDDLAADSSRAQAHIASIQMVSRRIMTGNRIVVAAARGYAVGGGFEWAIGCDLPLWGAGARAFFPEVEWGLFVTGGATAILPAIVGPVKAKEMMLLGGKYTAQELLALGVAWRVVADDALLNEAHAVAAQIAALPERSVRAMKSVLNKSTYADVETALELETQAAAAGSADPETQARVRNFKT